MDLLERLLNRHELEDALGLARGTMTTGTSKGRYADLPFIRVGRAIRYRPSDVRAWLAKHTHGAARADECEAA